MNLNPDCNESKQHLDLPQPQPPAPSSPAPPPPSSILQTPSSQKPKRKRGPLERPRYQWGKAARLPLQTRNYLNQSLRDGIPYAEISDRLNAQGFPGFTVQNISRWRRSIAYTQWLAQQEQFENASKKSEIIAALTGQLQPDGRSEISDLNELLVSSQFGSVFQDFNVESLKAHLVEKPADYVNLAKANAIHTMACVRRRRLELDRLQYEIGFRKQVKEAGSGKKRGGIPIEVWEEIEKELKLL